MSETPSRLSATLARCREQGRAALVGYLPAGFPDMETSVAAFAVMVASGVDVVEVGLPYSDPVMDGPTIQRAAEQALASGTRTADVFAVVEAVAGTGAPTLVMTYWNPVERHGVARFARAVNRAGGAGLITPDLIPEEGQEWHSASDREGLDRIYLVAPSSSNARLASTAAACRGFVYATSIMGVTGARRVTSSAAPALVSRVRSVTDLPVAVGLGVSNGAQAAEVAAFADAVIVGSAFVRCLLDGEDRAAGLAAVAELASELASSLHWADTAAPC